MYKFIFVFFCLVVNFQTAAQSITVQKKSNIESNATYTVVPLVFKNWAPSIVVTIQNQKIPLQFDLGAGKIELTLNQLLLKKLDNIQYTGRTIIVRDSYGREAISREFILPRIQLGSMMINHINGIETHPFPWGSGKGVVPEDARNGVIGLELLQKFNMLIDYKNKKMILIKNNHYPPGYNISTWQKIPFINNGHIVTQVKVGDKTANLLWDTGAVFNYIKPEMQVKSDMKACFETIANDLGIDCKRIVAKLVMNHHNFGEQDFYVVSMQGLPADGIIGEPFFRNHIVYINFSHRIIAVKQV